jgi:hypothetical protein
MVALTLLIVTLYVHCLSCRRNNLHISMYYCWSLFISAALFTFPTECTQLNDSRLPLPLFVTDGHVQLASPGTAVCSTGTVVQSSLSVRWCSYIPAGLRWMDPFLRETESEKFPSLLHDRACVRYPVASSESSCRECPAAHRELQVSGSLPAELWYGMWAFAAWCAR